MYFKIIKSNKTPDRVFLDNHPLVKFIDYPMDRISITDGVNVRVEIVSVKTSNIDIIDRLKREVKIKNRMFIIFPPNDNDVYQTITYNPYNFAPSRPIRHAEIELTPEEWNFMMKDELKKREEKYLKSLEPPRNYSYLLIR